MGWTRRSIGRCIRSLADRSTLRILQRPMNRSVTSKWHQCYDFSVRGIDIRHCTLDSPDAVRLIAALNAELLTTFPEPGATHFSLSNTQVMPGQGAFLVAYLDDVAVGCGAVRRLNEATAEIKRMYVDPSVRGRGIGRALVDALEREARLAGITRIVLETGTRLPQAIRLYEAMGYTRIPLFGEYLSSPDTSLCFGKALR